MPTVAQLMSDPEFHQFSVDERRQLLGEADPDYLKLSPEEQDQVLGSVMPEDIEVSERDSFGYKKFGKGLLTGVQQGVSNLGEMSLNVTGLGPLGRKMGVLPTSESGRSLEPVASSGEPRSWIPEAIGRQVPTLAMANPSGLLGSVLTGAVGGAADTGTPEGTAIGAASGGLVGLGGAAAQAGYNAAKGALPMVGAKAASLATNPAISGSIDAAAMVGIPGAGRLAGAKNLAGRYAARPAAGETMAELRRIAAEVKAAAEAKALAAEGRAHGVNTGFKPEAAGEVPAELASRGAPPPKAPAPPPGPTSSTGFQASPTSTPQVSFKLAPPPGPAAEKAAASTGKAPRPKLPPEQYDAAIEKLKTLGRAERSEVILELRAGGATSEEIGDALATSHRTRNGPDLDLDADDLDEAEKLVQTLGGKKFARAHLERIKDTLSAEEYSGMKNAIERAKHRAK